jgi:hypothetical protein
VGFAKSQGSKAKSTELGQSHVEQTEQGRSDTKDGQPNNNNNNAHLEQLLTTQTQLMQAMLQTLNNM